MKVQVRITFQGAYALSTNYKGYRIERQYMGYTKREAIQAFKEYIQAL